MPLPGPCALITALSAAGLPTDRFTFEGFLAHKGGPRQARLAALREDSATHVLYESPHRIQALLGDIREVLGERRVVLARELTKVHETVITDPLAMLRDRVAADENQRRGEIVLLVGGARERGEQHVVDTDALLRVLLDELPLKQAATLAARITGALDRNFQAEAVAHYVLARGQQGLVVAGTHGKTTTSAMLSWILETTGADPSYLVGGLPQWNPRGFRLGAGSHLVIEGDEYDTAFFDKGPKFMHYRPDTVLLGTVEFDHADIYRDLREVETACRLAPELTEYAPGHFARCHHVQREQEAAE